ncbi:MAG: bifunctional riboflavin kinase/FAD synthetase [Anaerolineae bacterium]|nr:bifunctional riboflavin kinase/FAD synthetase [Anaerolineae bacterium]
MRHIHSLEQADLSRPSVVTIGMFDGVHRGHQYLINQLLDQAHANHQVPVVLTFFPHPRMVIGGNQPHYYLTLPQTKAQLLGEMGIELVITHPFDDTVRHIRAAAFIESLVEYLNMRSLWVGKNFTLGYQREGNIDFLQTEAKRQDFDLQVIDMMDTGGERISSSRIRDALQVGDVTEAARLLGRIYRVPGQVIKGVGRGHTLGFPTANLTVPDEQAIPARGVYACWTLFGQAKIPTVTNIGLRPTFDGTNTQTIEAHLLDFSGELYGHSIELDFVARLRAEQKFSGPQALIDQIQRDIDQARTILDQVETPS